MLWWSLAWFLTFIQIAHGHAVRVKLRRKSWSILQDFNSWMIKFTAIWRKSNRHFGQFYQSRIEYIFAKLQFSWEKNLREQDNFFPRKSGPRSIFQKWTIVQFHFTFCIFFHIEESFIELWFIDPEILNFGLNCDGVKLLLPLLQGIDPLGSRMCFLLCTPTPLEWLARALQDFQPRRGTIWGKGITFKKKAQWNQVFFEVIFELFLIQ